MYKGASTLFPDTLTISFLFLSCVQCSTFITSCLHYNVRSPYIKIIYSLAKDSPHPKKFTISQEEGKEASHKTNKDKIFRSSHRKLESLAQTHTFKNLTLN